MKSIATELILKAECLVEPKWRFQLVEPCRVPSAMRIGACTHIRGLEISHRCRSLEDTAGLVRTCSRQWAENMFNLTHPRPK